ncbi:MAG TPA: glycosyltransferase family A protein [Rhodanobacteraceae bacterium]|nr:glycosyltransferase family A protein [Rhodanobacteraceae bacterium]
MMLSLDVVVRTLADAQRSELLFRALDSIQNQQGISARPIVVVNGQMFDPATLAALQERPGILLHQEQQASMRVARAAGRNLVTAPFFSYLDDDDEVIAGSLLEPLRWLDSHPDCDVLINNGYFVRDGGVLSESTHLANHVDRPAMGLLNECWLSPGACIFRTASISADTLDADWNHLEWTHLAFELCAQRKRLHFMDVPTVRYYDTPGSMSKQVRHHEVALDLLRVVQQDTRLDPEVRQEADRKYLRTLHNLAMTYWQRGHYLRAWRCHLGSLRPPHTFKYLLFSRKLLWPFNRPKPGTVAMSHLSDGE